MGKNRLKKAAQIVITQCLGIKKGEKVLIITDRPCRKIGETLWDALVDNRGSLLIEIPPTGGHGREPSPVVADLLKKFDAFIIPTSFSLTHTQARLQATKLGIRGATMPGINTDVMIRTLNADYHRIENLTKRMAGLLTRTKSVLIKTGKNSELYLDISSRQGYADTGIIRTKGSFSNLPAGEAYCAPLENKSEGEIVIDGSFAPVGKLKEPVLLKIKSGRIVKLSGNKELENLFENGGEKGRVLCEFGIGTNYKAKITGNVLEDEKVMGTIHIAFGNNLCFGGRNTAHIHLDGVTRKPWVWFENELIIKQGIFLL